MGVVVQEWLDGREIGHDREESIPNRTHDQHPAKALFEFMSLEDMDRSCDEEESCEDG